MTLEEHIDKAWSDGIGKYSVIHNKTESNIYRISYLMAQDYLLEHEVYALNSYPLFAISSNVSVDFFAGMLYHKWVDGFESLFKYE